MTTMFVELEITMEQAPHLCFKTSYSVDTTMEHAPFQLHLHQLLCRTLEISSLLILLMLILDRLLTSV